MSVKGKKAPEHCSTPFCYSDSIGEAYRTFGGIAWLRYYEQLHQWKAIHPSILWDPKDITLWMWLMGVPMAVGQHFVVQPVVRGQRQGSQLRLAMVVAGSLMTDNVSLVGNADTGTNVSVAGEITCCPGISRGEKALPENLTRRGETPVKVSGMVPFLRVYPYRVAVLLWQVFSGGFRIPCSSRPPEGEMGNLSVALSRPAVVTEKIVKEVGMGRITGLFPEGPILGLCISPLGLVTKK